MTQKQIRELREDLNKYQELKRTTQNIKEELITDLENLRRKNQTEILKTETSHSQTKHSGRPI
jgi:hypothetical protein